MTKFEFDNKITIGNIITIAISLLALVGAWYDVKSDTSANSKRLDSTEWQMKQIPAEYVRKDIFNTQELRLQRIESKLDRLIERAN